MRWLTTSGWPRSARGSGAGAQQAVAVDVRLEARAQRDVLEQDLAQARLALAETQRQMRAAIVRAPFDGVVAERFTQRGEFLAVGGAVVRLVNPARLEVSAQLRLRTLQPKSQRRRVEANAVEPSARDRLGPEERRRVAVHRALPSLCRRVLRRRDDGADDAAAGAAARCDRRELRARSQALIGRRLARIKVSARDVPGVLARITATVADAGANIEEVHHQRAFTMLAAQNVEIELVLQTRGKSHVEQVLDQLRTAGMEAALM